MGRQNNNCLKPEYTRAVFRQRFRIRGGADGRAYCRAGLIAFKLEITQAAVQAAFAGGQFPVGS